MNHGNILAEGSIAELAEDHGERNLEELFYRLISESEKDTQEFVH